HVDGKLVEPLASSVAAQKVGQKPLAKQFSQSPPRNCAPALGQMRIARLKLKITRDRRRKVLDALALGRDGFDDRRIPHIRAMGERKQGLEFLLRSQNALTVGLVDNKNVADLHYSGLDRLNIV